MQQIAIEKNNRPGLDWHSVVIGLGKIKILNHIFEALIAVFGAGLDDARGMRPRNDIPKELIAAGAFYPRRLKQLVGQGSQPS
jgi:hypothetical protein